MGENEETYSLFPLEKPSSENRNEFTSFSRFSSFSAKRNAAGIEHYFINTTWYRNNIVILTFAMVTLFTVLFVARELISSAFKEKLASFTQEIINSTQSRISKAILSTIREPYYYSTFFSDFFMQQSQHSINISSDITMFVDLFAKAHQSGSGEIVWWDVATIWGDYLSIETQIPGSRKITIRYANGSSDTDLMPIYEWISSDDGKNDSFPDGEGNFLSYERLTERNWYLMAKSRMTSFTDIHQTVSSFKSIMTLTNTAPLFDEERKFLAAFSNGITIEHIDDIIESLIPSNRSHLALIASDDVVARDGAEIETYNNTVLLHNIQSTEDIEWKTATSDPRFGDGFMFALIVDGEEILYSSDVIRLDVVGGTNWELATLLCITDFINGNSTFGGEFVIVAVPPLILLVISIVSLIARSTIRLNYQNRIIRSGDKFNCCLDHAQKSIKKLKSSHADIERIMTLVDAIIPELSQNLFYDTSKLINDVKDLETKEAIGRSFTHSTSRVTFMTAKINRLSYSTKDSQLCSDIILELFSRINNNFSHEEKLINTVSESLRPFKLDQLRSLADSLNLVLHVVSINVDTCISIFLFLLCFFIAKAKSYVPTNIITRYYILNTDQITEEALYILGKLQDFCDSDRFEYVADLLFDLVNMSPISLHHSALMSYIKSPTEVGIAAVLSNAAQVSILSDPNYTLGESFSPFEKSIRTHYLNPALLIIDKRNPTHI